MIELWEPQQRCVTGIRSAFQRGVRRVVLVSPTGSGKTVMFSHMTQHAAARRKRIWICAHRQELIAQIGGTLERFEVEFGVIAPGHKHRDAAVQVASVFTLARRLDQYEEPDLIIMDEAHHCVSATTWGKVAAAYPNTFLLGVTATPERTDGHGLGECFDEMVLGPTTRELIDQGRLSKYELYRPPSTLDLSGLRKRGGDYEKAQLEDRVERSSITGNAVQHHQHYCSGKRALAFCVSVRHAEMTAQMFRDAGIAAASIDGTSTNRRELIRDLASGQLTVLTSCDLLSEGFDCPAVESAHLLRPSDSLIVVRQQIGRTLRFHPEKPMSFIFDHAGNTKKHGLPDDEPEWSLQGHAAKKMADKVTAVRTCKNCFAVFRAGPGVCPYCQAVMPTRDREVEVKQGVLEKVDKELARAVAKGHRMDQGRTKSLEELVALGRSRGYAHPQAWAYHVFKSRKRR